MKMRNYCVSLDEEVVKKALKISKKFGGKLSPLINQMLKDWCEEEEENADEYSRN